MRKKKGSEPSETAEEMFAGGVPARITPEDIQRKEFAVARLGGYRMHEVDEFLDDLTRAMGELMQENEELRRRPTSGRPAWSAGAVSGDAVRPFLDQEREFLRSLGGLVQEHMDAIRSMARTPRDDEAGAQPVGETEEAAQAPPAEGMAPGPAEPASAEQGSTEPEPAVAPAADRGGPVAQPARAASPPPAAPTEPIRLEEPHPIASVRGDESGLRELFWGEDE